MVINMSLVSSVRASFICSRAVSLSFSFSLSLSPLPWFQIKAVSEGEGGYSAGEGDKRLCERAIRARGVTLALIRIITNYDKYERYCYLHVFTLIIKHFQLTWGRCQFCEKKIVKAPAPANFCCSWSLLSTHFCAVCFKHTNIFSLPDWDLLLQL